MNLLTWPQLVLFSFGVGYFTRHFDLITFTRDFVEALPDTAHKSLLMLCLLGICLVFLAIVIPLERIAEFEHGSSLDYHHHSSAREQLKRRGSF
ncbi:hypothetical protein IWQ60_004732 [Tieghemiomyces parasiticus]|uniref:Uncharacterized protein n=1 Tax=Tieghemiomyces parasiticus TaxID=78921 RepID=A0A9W8AFF3_9FUNG|nr:hypothetical protein IWQ60_004732 [Tieghemiomyces parasiticus]